MSFQPVAKTTTSALSSTPSAKRIPSSVKRSISCPCLTFMLPSMICLEHPTSNLKISEKRNENEVGVDPFWTTENRDSRSILLLFRRLWEGTLPRQGRSPDKIHVSLVPRAGPYRARPWELSLLFLLPGAGEEQWVSFKRRYTTRTPDLKQEYCCNLVPEQRD